MIGPPAARPPHQAAGVTRQKCIHHHKYMFTVSNETNVYSILNNCCICIHISEELCRS